MSCQEIGGYIEARQEREQAEKKAEEEIKFMDSATLLNGFFIQLRAYFVAKDSRVLTPRDLYPNLFKEKKASPPADISPERKQRIITNTWKAFLDV